MISDNFLTGDRIYLRELQNFFFEVLGMMSITHYGAVGDGRTDNYGPIQVAIDDANRRKLYFIYVPYGRYIYTGEFINIGNIKFVGNPKAEIVNIRTGEKIEILQFGVDTNDVYTKDEVYTKAEVDALLEEITGNVYTKAEIDALLAKKKDKEEEEDEDEVKAIITGGISENITLEDSTGDLTLDTSIKAGTTPSLLTIENGCIVIGAGVTKVKVSAQLNFLPNKQDTNPRYVNILKVSGENENSNDFTIGETEGLAQTLDKIESYGSYQYRSLVVSSVIKQVQVGDKIKVQYGGFGADEVIQSYGTQLTVEVVEAST